MAFSSMYIGATGMKAHGEGMGVLSNNIANVSTVGFKESDFHFATLMSDHVVTGEPGGISQRGLGVGMSDVQINYHQGPVNPTNTTTDLAISGKGFFQVTDGQNVFYTRAGNFRFDKDGFLVDPHGLRLQGTDISGVGAGGTGDIQLSLDDNGQFFLQPEATSSVAMYTNLGSDGGDRSVNPENPFFAMLTNWDANSPSQPLDSTEFSYENTIVVYDSLGNKHDLNVYYDEVTVSNAGGKSYFEYVVGMDPNEVEGNGVLMTGTLTFSSKGELIGQTAYTLGDVASDPKDLTNWTPASFSENGFPQVNVPYATTSNAAPAASALEIDLGLESTGGGWTTGAGTTAADIGLDPSNLPGADWERRPPATSNFAGTSSTIMQVQDGYGSGVLNRIDVSTDGVVSGYYTNGQVSELYRINLYNFPSEYGLRSEGGNLYTATPASGAAIEGQPETGGMGSVSQSSLEDSNVDLAAEMVMMILTQRGFQGNSKAITTSDAMLSTAINLKR